MSSSPFRDLSPLLAPQSIAVVGASERAGSAGRLVLENLQNLGYTGTIYAVHPQHQQILRVPSYPNLAALPGPVDSVAILRAAGHVLPALQTAAEIGARAAWVLASGFAEAGPEGQARQKELTNLAQETGLLVCGPNTIGIANLVDRVATYSTALSPALRPGHVSAVVQSGAICMGLANSGRLGFRFLIASGNEAVLDSADYIGYLVADPHTRVIIGFLEEIRNPKKFMTAAEAAVKANKPILLVKVGRSAIAQRAVQAHTGSLAGSDAVVDTVLRHLGVARLDSLNALVEAADLFLTAPHPTGEGVGLLSLSGGQIGLVADLAEGLHLQFPPLSETTKQALGNILPAYSPLTNPLDAWGSGDLENTYPQCVEIVARDPSIHLLAVSRDTPPPVAQREVDQSLAVARATIQAAQETGKPALLFSNLSAGFHPKVKALLDNAAIPYLQGTAETLQSIQALIRYSDFRRRRDHPLPTGGPSPDCLPQWRERLGAASGTLSEIQGRRLLADYGIPGPREMVAATAEEAIEAAGHLGYPVVLKILSPDIPHKSEFGGVRVGLEDEAAVTTAFHEIMGAVRKYHPQARLEGVIVQENLPATAVEVLLGILRDPDFGPVVVFGAGGTLTEILHDSALRLPPIDHREARALIQETRVASLLQGFRGRPAADVDALVDSLVRFSQLAADLGNSIAAMDVNPLMVLPQGEGVRAVDVLVESIYARG